MICDELAENIREEGEPLSYTQEGLIVCYEGQKYLIDELNIVTQC